MGIKAEGPISFKSAESVADSHKFKTMHLLYNKTFFHSTTFLSAFAFFPMGLLSDIEKTIKHRYTVIKRVIEFFPFRKTDRFNCEILYKET